MKLNQILAAAVVATSFISAPALAAGNAEAGKTKAYTCLGCHNSPGYFNVYPSYHVPKIWGQHQAYIVDALKTYKNGQRNHPTMTSQAANLSDQDMADIAAYFAGQAAAE